VPGILRPDKSDIGRSTLARDCGQCARSNRLGRERMREAGEGAEQCVDHGWDERGGRGHGEARRPSGAADHCGLHVRGKEVRIAEGA